MKSKRKKLKSSKEGLLWTLDQLNLTITVTELALKGRLKLSENKSEEDTLFDTLNNLREYLHEVNLSICEYIYDHE